MQWWPLLWTPNESVTAQCLKTKLFPFWAHYLYGKLINGYLFMKFYQNIISQNLIFPEYMQLNRNFLSHNKKVVIKVQKINLYIINIRLYWKNQTNSNITYKTFVYRFIHLVGGSESRNVKTEADVVHTKWSLTTTALELFSTAFDHWNDCFEIWRFSIVCLLRQHSS